MAENITLTASIRANLLSLQNTNSLLNRTSERLSTGLRVNSALDDPGAYFTARGLTNRANDLSKLKDGIGQAIQTIKATDTALKSITALVEQAQSIAAQAVEAAANAGTSVTSIIGTAAGTGVTAGQTLSTAFGAQVSTGDILTVSVTNGGSVKITGGQTITSALASISAADSTVTATYDSTTRQITVVAGDGVKLTFTNSTGDNIVTGIFGTAVTPATAVTFGAVGGASTTSLATDYNKVKAQIDLLIADATYKGVNLLNNVDMKVTFDEDGQSKLTVSGTDLKTDLAISTANWSTGGSISGDVTKIAAALTQLRTVSSQYGTDLGIIQTREDFTTTFITGLQEGSGRLVNANLEEESANLLALQTRQALGTTSLSFANQSQQSILQLFR